MFLSYERSLQPDLVGADIIVPIAGLVGSRDPGPSASDQHTETAFAQEADVQRHGPLDLCRAVSIGANSSKRSGGFEAAPLGSLTPADAPLTDAEILFRQRGPAHFSKPLTVGFLSARA